MADNSNRRPAWTSRAATQTQWQFRPYWKRVRIPPLALGDHVRVPSSSNRSANQEKTGSVRYLGKNDGSLEGRRYFVCAPQRGLFVPAARCRKRGKHGASRGRRALLSAQLVRIGVSDRRPPRSTVSNKRSRAVANVHAATSTCASEAYWYTLAAAPAGTRGTGNAAASSSRRTQFTAVSYEPWTSQTTTALETPSIPSSPSTVGLGGEGSLAFNRESKHSRDLGGPGNPRWDFDYSTESCWQAFSFRADDRRQESGSELSPPQIDLDKVLDEVFAQMTVDRALEGANGRATTQTANGRATTQNGRATTQTATASWAVGKNGGGSALTTNTWVSQGRCQHPSSRGNTSESGCNDGWRHDRGAQRDASTLTPDEVPLPSGALSSTRNIASGEHEDHSEVEQVVSTSISDAHSVVGTYGETALAHQRNDGNGCSLTLSLLENPSLQLPPSVRSPGPFLRVITSKRRVARGAASGARQTEFSEQKRGSHESLCGGLHPGPQRSGHALHNRAGISSSLEATAAARHEHAIVEVCPSRCVETTVACVAAADANSRHTPTSRLGNVGSRSMASSTATAAPSCFEKGERGLEDREQKFLLYGVPTGQRRSGEHRGCFSDSETIPANKQTSYVVRMVGRRNRRNKDTNIRPFADAEKEGVVSPTAEGRSVVGATRGEIRAPGCRDIVDWPRQGVEVGNMSSSQTVCRSAPTSPLRVVEEPQRQVCSARRGQLGSTAPKDQGGCEARSRPTAVHPRSRRRHGEYVFDITGSLAEGTDPSARSSRCHIQPREEKQDLFFVEEGYVVGKPTTGVIQASLCTPTHLVAPRTLRYELQQVALAGYNGCSFLLGSSNQVVSCTSYVPAEEIAVGSGNQNFPPQPIQNPPEAPAKGTTAGERDIIHAIEEFSRDTATGVMRLSELAPTESINRGALEKPGREPQILESRRLVGASGTTPIGLKQNVPVGEILETALHVGQRYAGCKYAIGRQPVHLPEDAERCWKESPTAAWSRSKISLRTANALRCDLFTGFQPALAECPIPNEAVGDTGGSSRYEKSTLTSYACERGTGVASVAIDEGVRVDGSLQAISVERAPHPPPPLALLDSLQVKTTVNTTVPGEEYDEQSATKAGPSAKGTPTSSAMVSPADSTGSPWLCPFSPPPPPPPPPPTASPQPFHQVAEPDADSGASPESNSTNFRFRNIDSGECVSPHSPPPLASWRRQERRERRQRVAAAEQANSERQAFGAKSTSTCMPLTQPSLHERGGNATPLKLSPENTSARLVYHHRDASQFPRSGCLTYHASDQTGFPRACAASVQSCGRRGDNTPLGKYARGCRCHRRMLPPPGPPPSPSPTLRLAAANLGEGTVPVRRRPGFSARGREQRGGEDYETCRLCRKARVAADNPTATAIDDAASSINIAPASFLQKKRRAVNGQEDALADLAAAAIPLVPPPTPPPPEARRRRKKRSPYNSPAAPTVSAGTPPGPPIFAGSTHDGLDDRVDREIVPRTLQDQPPARRSSFNRAGRASGGDPDKIQPNPTAGSPVTDDDYFTNGRQGSSPSERHGWSGMGRKASTGGWGSSSAGSEAKRRADEIIARVEALELSFSRVEAKSFGSPSKQMGTGVDRECVRGVPGRDVRSCSASAPNATTAAAGGSSAKVDRQDEAKGGNAGASVSTNNTEGLDDPATGNVLVPEMLIGHDELTTPSALLGNASWQTTDSHDKISWLLDAVHPTAIIPAKGDSSNDSQRNLLHCKKALVPRDHLSESSQLGTGREQVVGQAGLDEDHISFYFNLGRSMVQESLQQR